MILSSIAVQEQVFFMAWVLQYNTMVQYSTTGGGGCIITINIMEVSSHLLSGDHNHVFVIQLHFIIIICE